MKTKNDPFLSLIFQRTGTKTMDEAAKKIGISPAQFSRIISLKSEISEAVKEKLINIGLTIDEINNFIALNTNSAVVIEIHISIVIKLAEVMAKIKTDCVTDAFIKKLQLLYNEYGSIEQSAVEGLLKMELAKRK